MCRSGRVAAQGGSCGRFRGSSGSGWFKKSADDAADYLEVEAAVIELAYLYRDTELSRDYLEAYKWLVVIGSSLDPPYYDDAKLPNCEI